MFSSSCCAAASIPSKQGTSPGQGSPDFLTAICKQAGLSLAQLSTDFPLYDADCGKILAVDVDRRVEELRDSLMQEVGRSSDDNSEEKPALGPTLEAALERYKETAESSLDILDHRVLDWHWAHLEYACAAPLEEVKLAQWEPREGGRGAMCVVEGGAAKVMAALADGLDVRLQSEVSTIDYGADGPVKVCG